jgi:nitrate reductase NapA
MHPVLFSRLLERRLKNPNVKIIALETRVTRTSRAADKTMIFEPQSDLAIGNAVAQQIIENKWVNESFVKDHINFKSGKTDVGYGLKDKEKFKEEPKAINIEEYAEFLKDYTPLKASEISGVSESDIKYSESIW